jgi:hypothetical protein
MEKLLRRDGLFCIRSKTGKDVQQDGATTHTKGILLLESRSYDISTATNEYVLKSRAKYLLSRN